MTMRAIHFPILVFVVLLFGTSAFSQTTERRQTNATTVSQEQSPGATPNVASIDVVATELGLLRKELQTLNIRLRDISSKVLAPNVTSRGSAKDTQNPILLNLALLSQAEQRAELMRKQLFELVEKETSLRSRLVQIEEDMRPENIERSMNLVGTTRTAELRDTRRRVLESDRKGIESLLSQTTQSRQRLDEDVRQADLLVSKLRQRLLPLIENEIEKINPN